MAAYNTDTSGPAPTRVELVRELRETVTEHAVWRERVPAKTAANAGGPAFAKLDAPDTSDTPNEHDGQTDLPHRRRRLDTQKLWLVSQTKWT